jgi:hypothetical protein
MEIQTFMMKRQPLAQAKSQVLDNFSSHWRKTHRVGVKLPDVVQQAVTFERDNI